MTVYVPLAEGADASLPDTPSFLAQDAAASKLSEVVKAVSKARRIVVVSGAGISVDAGIPDFRSSNGLFNTLKRANPKDGLSSGKDLFDASVFTSEQSASMFYQMIAKLSDMSLNALPTSFHSLLRKLDERGQLLRHYTQNIDALEQKAGLSFGVPSFQDRPRTKRPRLESEAISDGSTLKAETLPKCIPLHGTLQKMHCSLCSTSVDLEPYVKELRKGSPPHCPTCKSLESTRLLVGKRPRGVGILRPSVVLYGETHREGEGVGEVVRRDLIGKGTGKGRGNKGGDLLIVVGTSLKIPGTKRIVREFSKSVRMNDLQLPDEIEAGSKIGYLPTPNPSPRRSPKQRASPAFDTEDKPIRTVFVNYDFPVPSREFDGVFDVWVQGDAQEFARLLLDEIHIKEATAEKKKISRERSQSEGTQQQLKRKAPPSPPPTPSIARQIEEHTKRIKIPTSYSSQTPTTPRKVKLHVKLPLSSVRSTLSPTSRRSISSSPSPSPTSRKQQRGRRRTNKSGSVDSPSPSTPIPVVCPIPSPPSSPKHADSAKTSNRFPIAEVLISLRSGKRSAVIKR